MNFPEKVHGILSHLEYSKWWDKHPSVEGEEF
jgi:hypothetical protein